MLLLTRIYISNTINFQTTLICKTCGCVPLTKAIPGGYKEVQWKSVIWVGHGSVCQIFFFFFCWHFQTFYFGPLLDFYFLLQKIMMLIFCINQNKVHIIDPSDKFRPEKEESLFRDFTKNTPYYNKVENTYRQMHTNQTHVFAKQKVSVEAYTTDKGKSNPMSLQSTRCVS